MDHRAGGHHLGVKQRMAREVAMERPTMSIGPCHHRRHGKTIAALIFQAVTQRSSQGASKYLHPKSDDIALVVAVLAEEEHLPQANRGEVSARP
jgi:hypothetical protein